MNITGTVRLQKWALDNGILTKKEMKQMGNGHCPTVEDFNDDYCIKEVDGKRYVIKMVNNRNYQRVDKIIREINNEN